MASPAAHRLSARWAWGGCLLLAGCRGGSTDDPFPTRVTPSVEGPADPDIGLVRVWTAELDRAAAVTLEVSGGGEHWTVASPAATTHRVALLGLLPETGYRVEASAGSLVLDPVTFTTEGPPDTALWPTVEPLEWRPDEAEPGWTLAPVDSSGEPDGLVVVWDEEWRPRWWWFVRGQKVYDAVPDGHGGLWTWLGLTTARHADWTGDTLAWFDTRALDGAIPLSTGAVDHEVLDDGEGGFWTFGHHDQPGEVPIAYGSHETREAMVQDTPFTHVRADGTVAASFPIADLLDPTRCGYGALDPGALTTALNVVHANSGIPLEDGGVLVSVASQDVVLRLEADGSIRWMLGDPSGWSEPWARLFLAPVGELVWPYGQHGLEWHPERRLLLMLDNHGVDHTPYGPPSGPGRSARGVGFELDETARTVRQVWEDDQTSTGTVRAPNLGEVDELPVTGHRLVVYGHVRGAETDDPSTVRLVEVDPDTGERFLDLRISAPADVAPSGVFAYRAVRGLPPLHP